MKFPSEVAADTPRRDDSLELAQIKAVITVVTASNNVTAAATMARVLEAKLSK